MRISHWASALAAAGSCCGEFCQRLLVILHSDHVDGFRQFRMVAMVRHDLRKDRFCGLIVALADLHHSQADLCQHSIVSIGPVRDDLVEERDGLIVLSGVAEGAGDLVQGLGQTRIVAVLAVELGQGDFSGVRSWVQMLQIARPICSQMPCRWFGAAAAARV